ncbi:MAG: carboxypeptidase regulatory-like domain-containing protein, partial [Vicinamibacteraceae bacterium]
MVGLSCTRIHRTAAAIARLVGIAVLGVPALGLAQTGGTAGVYGTVQDPAGAVATNVQVMLVNADTEWTQTTFTGGNGQFVFRFVPVGRYELLAEKEGFQQYRQSGIVLQVNDNPRLDVRLAVGDVTTTVSVAASAPLVQTRGTEIKSIVDSRRIVDLPLNGRNLADLALLSPGTVPANDTGGTDKNGNGDGVKIPLGSRQFSINGARNNETRYTLDGADNNDTMYNAGMPFPFPNAVQEFTVVTSGKGADVGSSPGGTINIVTRSGTNQPHGDAFWFVRNTAFNANNFFSQTGDQLRRNQGGFTLGGPILENRLFLFGGWQRTWVRQTIGSNFAEAMPAAYRRGDFADLLHPSDPNQAPLQLVSPSGEPYPHNQIPSSEWSPAMQRLLEYWPEPDENGLVQAPIIANTDIAQYIVRGDYMINPSHTVYGRYLGQPSESPRPLVGDNLATSENGSTLTTHSGTLAWTATVSSNLVSYANVFVNYAPAQRTLDAPWGNITALGVELNPLASELDIVLDGTSGFDLGSASRGADFRRASFGFANSWHWARGRHNVSFGGEMRWTRYNEYNPYHGSGVFTFDGRCTGFDQADALIGCLSEFTQGKGEFEFRRHHYQALFVGDSIRLTDRITLDAGLRWEPYTPITDVGDRTLLFLPEKYEAGERSQVWLQSPPGLFYPGDTVDGKTVPDGASEASWDLFAPRLGFAWDVLGDGRLSVRAGGGIYYSLPEVYLLNALSDQAPFGYDQIFQGGVFDDPYRGRESANVFPLSESFANDPNLPFPSPLFAYAQEPTFEQATTYAWNLSIQRQLLQNWLVEISYVGNKSTHLPYVRDLNAPIYDFDLSERENLETMQERRPFPEYERLYILSTGQNANYNGLQLHVQRRFDRGFSLTASYTFAKALDYASTNDSVEEMADGNSVPNPFDPRYFYGPSDFDRRHVFVSSLLWNLPSAGGAGTVLDALTRGWTASAVVTIHSGRPFTVTASSTQAACNDCQPHADQIGALTFDNDRSKSEWLEEYFNTANVTAGAPGTFGNIGRNSLYGPGYANVDLALSRAFALPLQGGGTLELRAEAFNLLN